MQRLWRKLFNRQTVEKSQENKTAEPVNKGRVIEEGVSENGEIEGETPEEAEARRDLARDLESQRGERSLLESIKRSQEAQKEMSRIPR